MKEIEFITDTGSLDKEGLVLLACDEGGIKCNLLGDLRGVVGQSMGVVLAMPDVQLQRGLRGLTKARIMSHVLGDVRGVYPVTPDQLKEEIEEPWQRIVIPGPLMWQETRTIVGDSGEMQKITFEETDDPIDIGFMERAKLQVGNSNCWFDPAGCVATLHSRVVAEGGSTRYHGFACKSELMEIGELGLNPGERMMFCDALHAERQVVAQAAKNGQDLKGATIYVTKYPCRPCAQVCVAAGVSRVVFEADSYGIAEVGDMFIQNGVRVARIRS